MSVADFLAELRPRVAGELRDDLYARTLYSTDASLYQVMPYGVLIPRHADDMQAAVELAAKHHVPLLPRAAGSSLAGQSVNTALVMDTSRYLDQVLEINAEEGWVRVQPGVVLDKLNGALRPHGLQFGPDPASSNRACLGGIVSNNATGSHSILYGMTADHVLEMQVILDDGAYAHLQPARRRTGGLAGAAGESPGRDHRQVLPRWSATSATVPPSAPARRATGGAAAATTWRALSTTAASTTTCRRTRASTWRSWSAGPRARWPPSPSSSSSWCRAPS